MKKSINRTVPNININNIILEVKESEIKSSTILLLQQQIIFHPYISPNGKPDFTNHLGRQYVLIIDRNILTKLIELCRNGCLKDTHIMKLIGSLMFWVLFNNVSVTAGLALNEYANNKNNNIDAIRENYIFKKIFDFYDPKLWLELAIKNRKKIPKIEFNSKLENYKFNIKSDHYKMHYAEMLHAMSLCFQNNLSIEEKIINFLQWNKDNLLFCQYTIVYILLLFSNKIKQHKELLLQTFESLAKKCSNQAWDITYLSVWSTLYWNENDGNISYLFSTMDKDLKKIFNYTHDVKKNIFIVCLGKHKGVIVQKKYEEIINIRIKPVMTTEIVNDLVKREETKLKDSIKDLC